MSFKKLLHDILTENDGTSYCPVRVFGGVLLTLAIPAFITGSIASLFIPWVHFPMMEFAGAVGSILASIAVLGGGIAFKAKTDTNNG